MPLVKFSETGGPYSYAPPLGDAFKVNSLDVDNTVFDISESAYALLRKRGAYLANNEKVNEAPNVVDKKRAEYTPNKPGKKKKK